MATGLHTDVDLAQSQCDDIVLAAGVFKPNAPGRTELSGFRALSERQLLKSRGAFFVERMLLAVTPIDVVAIALGPVSIWHPRRLLWKRSTLRATRIPAVAETFRPFEVALCLPRADGSPRLEVARYADDDGAWDVIERLTRPARP
ncbi:MAG: hypothetical protein JWL73_2057 [Actinomycetia bacterium]|nr:hypothetical protein [Actinomycetes bacterium]